MRDSDDNIYSRRNTLSSQTYRKKFSGEISREKDKIGEKRMYKKRMDTLKKRIERKNGTKKAMEMKERKERIKKEGVEIDSTKEEIERQIKEREKMKEYRKWGSKRTSKIRSLLSLDEHPWIGMDDDLIELCFISRKLTESDIFKEYSERMGKKYRFKDLENIEFLGDKILAMIIRSHIYSNIYSNIERKHIFKISSTLENNVTIGCNSKLKGICNLSWEDSVLKRCADIIEALIGILYFYQKYIERNPHAFNIVKTWYIKNFFLEEHISILDKQGDEFNIYKPCDKKSKYCPCETISGSKSF